MAKIIKAKKKVYKQKVIAGKYGLVFSSEVTPHLRKVIEDGEKSLQNGTAKTVTVDEIMGFLRNLHD